MSEGSCPGLGGAGPDTMSETVRPPDSRLDDDRRLVNLIGDGQAAERGLRGLEEMVAADGVASDAALREALERAALEARRDNGRAAAAAIYLRYEPNIFAIARSLGLRSRRNRDDASEGAEMPSVEEFLNDFYEKVLCSPKVLTWQGRTEFPGWLRRVLKNRVTDIRRRIARERKRWVELDEDTKRESSQWGDEPLAGATDDADVPAAATDLSAPHQDGGEGAGVMLVDAGPERAGSVDSHETENARRKTWLDRMLATMPADRRVAYRLLHALELTADDLAHLARKSRRPELSVREDVARLYEWFRERSDAKYAKIARRRWMIKAQLRSVNAKLRAGEGRAQEGQAMERLTSRSREFQDELVKLYDSVKKIRIPSKHVADMMKTTMNNIDQHLKRARQDIESARGDTS